MVINVEYSQLDPLLRATGHPNGDINCETGNSPFHGNINQDKVNERELTALKAVIKCIEEHKLEEQYPLDPLQKWVLQLEKAKADKKRATEAAKPQPKRPRANGVGYVVADKTFYARVTDRYPQYIYDRQYVYPGPTDNYGPSLLGSVAYNISPNHGNYFGNGYQYQAPYLH